MSAGGTDLTAAADSASAMGVMGALDDSKSMYHALPSLPANHVHCAQLEDGFECIMQTVPIVATLSRHQCKGACGRNMHAQCGHQFGDKEMDRTLTGGPGMISCSCGKTGKCTNCKCAKAGRRCNSSCRCSRFSMCTNMEAMEALDKAILERSELDEVNVALTRSEIA